MKILLTNYVIGFCSYLDERGIKWEMVDAKKQSIKIECKDMNDFFMIVFKFGRKYERDN